MNEKISKRKLVSVVLWGTVGVLVLLMVLLMAKGKPKEETAAVAEKAVPVRVLLMEPREIPDVVEIPGRLEAWNSAVLATEQEGRVMELLADRGDDVKEGQVLLKIDSRLWEETLKKAEVEIRESEKYVARWTELKKAGAVSPDDYDNVQTVKDRAEIAQEEARVMISQCEVKSPIEGRINDRMVEKGEYANKGQAVFQVVDIRRLKLKMDIPERDILHVAAGQLIPLTVPAYPGQVFTGEVTFVASMANPDSNTFALEALVDNASGALKGGMIAKANLTRGVREEALAVPLASIVPKKGEHILFVVNNGRAERRVVKIDAINGAEAILGDGVRMGEDVVIEGQRTLQDGLLLDVRRAAASSAEKSE
ncbi:MAG: efflux RND transporter periplasmic adaptor subunit [Lentisphaerota bacterium]